jgi:Mrp family chromosome partitioning ATPase
VVKVSPRFSVLPAGRPGHSPLAGLTSDRMRELLDQFETQFDWIILDTPPVGFLPDGQLLARLTRAVVFVIGANSSQYATVERAVADLGRDCIIGTVLNRVDESAIPDKAYYDEYQAAR